MASTPSFSPTKSPAQSPTSDTGTDDGSDFFRTISMRSDVSTPGAETNIGACGNKKHHKAAKSCQRIRDASWFQTTLIGVIFFAGILVGIQTYDIPPGAFETVLEVLDTIVLWIFILEIVIKLIAEGRTPWLFFKDGWNVFDFTIVAVGLLPFGGSAVTALRLVRLLRVLKLVRALPKLRILVMGLLLSMSSIAYIGMLLMLLFYLYAVLGVSIFGGNDPIHFGTLHMALITLFRCATLEDWTDVMYIAFYGCDVYGYGGMEEFCDKPNSTPLVSVIFFCTFVILSAMMILNLFIGVITTSMAEAKNDLSAEADAAAIAKLSTNTIGPRLAKLGQELATMQAEMKAIVASKKHIRKAVEAMKRAQAHQPPKADDRQRRLANRANIMQAVRASAAADDSAAAAAASATAAAASASAAKAGREATAAADSTMVANPNAGDRDGVVSANDLLFTPSAKTLTLRKTST